MRYTRTRPQRDFGLIFGDGDRMVAALPRYRRITKIMPTRWPELFDIIGTSFSDRAMKRDTFFYRFRYGHGSFVLFRFRFSNKPFVIASSNKNRFCIFFTYRKYLLILIWHHYVCYFSYMTISLVVGLP